MGDKSTKRYMELQMEELKDTYGVDESPDAKKSKENHARNEKNAEIAKLYEDAAEYEEDLASFEAELEIIHANKLEDIAKALTETLPSEERNYAAELKAVLEAGWAEESDKLEMIKEKDFEDIAATLQGDLETEVRDIFINRWKMLIEIKKEHIKEELAEIKVRGLKPNFVKRIYKQYHGIE